MNVLPLVLLVCAILLQLQQQTQAGVSSLDPKKCHEGRDRLRENLQQFNDHVNEDKVDRTFDILNKTTDEVRKLHELNLQTVEDRCKLLGSLETMTQRLAHLETKLNETNEYLFQRAITMFSKYTPFGGVRNGEPPLFQRTNRTLFRNSFNRWNNRVLS